MNVTVQALTFSNAVAQVSERTRAVACPESIAALTRRRSQWKALGAIVNSFALVQRGCQRAQRSRVWPGADGFVVIATVRMRSSQRHPGVAEIGRASCRERGVISDVSGVS